MKDPFNGKRGRQKGQTKDIVTIEASSNSQSDWLL